MPGGLAHAQQLGEEPEAALQVGGVQLGVRHVGQLEAGVGGVSGGHAGAFRVRQSAVVVGVDPAEVVDEVDEPVVAGIRVGPVGQVQQGRGDPRAALDLAGAAAAASLVGGEGGRDVVGPAQAVGEDGGVLDGLVRPLPVVREHRVGGVAEQHDPVLAPAGERGEREQPPARALRNRLDHLPHRGVPAPQRRAQRPFRGGRHAAGSGPAVGALEDGEEVDDVADRVVQQVGVGAHPELDGVRVGEFRQRAARNEAAEPAGPRVDGHASVTHFRTRERMPSAPTTRLAVMVEPSAKVSSCARPARGCR